MNSPAPTFDAEQARLAAAAHLQPAHFVEFQRLAKSLIHGPQFQLLIVDCRDERLRAKVLESLALIQQQAGLRGAELVLDDSVGDVQVLEARLVALAAEHEVIHVLGASYWMDAGRWASFNLLRERLAAMVRTRLLLWLDEVAIAQVVHHAPDLWAWRAGVYGFPSPSIGIGAIESRSREELWRRVVQLRGWLNEAPDLADDMRVPLHHELATLLAALGDAASCRPDV
jgi:hypothetical protein